MNNKLYSYTKISLIALAVCVFLFFVISFVTKSKIIIILADNTIAVETVVRVDGKIIPASGENGLKRETVVNYGSHEIVIQGMGKKSISKSVSTSLRNNKIIEIEPLSEVSAVEILSAVYNDPAVNFINPQYFSNKTWLAFIVAHKDGGLENYTGVARYESASASWKIVGEGTDLDFSQGLLQDAPEDLIIYVGGL